MMSDIEKQYGGCQCGYIRYAAPAEALACYVCHCSECRKQSSSAFGISYVVPRASFAVTRGAVAFWARTTDSGHRLDCAFCPQCGSRIWHQSSGDPDTLNIKGGTLDRPIDLGGGIHIWTDSKLAGVLIPKHASSFARAPRD